MPTYTQEEVDDMMKKRDGEEAVRAIQSGRVVFTPPVSDEPEMTKLSEREVIVHGSPSGKRRREFNGQPRRHCSGCRFPEGCIMCCLP